MIKHVKTLAACLSALLLAGCAASPTPAPTTTRYHVAMIAKSTSTEFWSAVFAGAEAAATEYNMDLTITGSESEEDYSSQNDLIEKAVEMKGDGFSPKVKVGDKIKKGDLLLEMDLTKIAAAGHPAVVITVITNTDDFAGVEVVASGTVEPGADLIKISK